MPDPKAVKRAEKNLGYNPYAVAKAAAKKHGLSKAEQEKVVRRVTKEGQKR